MKKLLTFILFTSFINCLSAQTNYGKSWPIGVFGYYLKFDVGIINHDTSIVNYEFGRGRSSICDSNGNLLIICNGMNLFNKNGLLIENGDTLVPKAWADFNQNSSRYYQASIILPIENKKYYVVTPALNDTQLTKSLALGNYAPCNILYYHVIDMNANAGLGKVIKKKVPIIENKELTKTQMMACRHANGKDWWLLKMAGDSNMVYTFLFTQDSVYNKGVQHIPFPWRGYFELQGQMTFSQDGSKWASTYCNNSGEVSVADFDRCTGLLSNFSLLTVPPQLSGYSLPVNVMDTANAGLSFSASGNMLYIARYSHVMQYSFATQAYYKVCGWDSILFTGYSSIGLAYNGKIYIGNFGGTTKQMSVIDNPDVSGAGCNFCPKCLRSKSYWGALTEPPCMPNYELGASAEVCWPLSLPNPPKEGVNGLVVYPNPTNDKFHLLFKDETKYQSKKELYNSVGQLIFSTTENEIDVSHVAKGVYYLKVENEVRKLVVE